MNKKVYVGFYHTYFHKHNVKLWKIQNKMLGWNM